VASPRTTRIGRRYQSGSEFALSSVRGPVIRLGALIERGPSIAGFNIGVNCGAAAAQTAVTGRPNVIEAVTFAGRDFSISARWGLSHESGGGAEDGTACIGALAKAARIRR